MKTIKLVSASVIALYATNPSMAFDELQICSGSDNIMSNNFENIINKPGKQITEDDNDSTRETVESDCEPIKETKNALKNVKVQLSEAENISELQKNLTGKTVTIISSQNPNSFSIGPSNKKEPTISSDSFSIVPSQKKETLNTTSPDSFSIGPTYRNSKAEKKIKLEKAIINKMDEYAEDYLLKEKNTKVFVYNSKTQLNKCIEEANKLNFKGTIVYLDKQLINKALGDISKNKNGYKKILRNNINYNIVINLFKLNAKHDEKVFNIIAKELDAHGYDLQNFSKIVEIYDKAYDRTIALQRTALPSGEQPNNNRNFDISHPNSFGFNNKLKKTNVASFSIIGNKHDTENEYKKYDNLKIDNSTYLHEITNNLSKLDQDEKSELLNDVSETLTSNVSNLPSNFKVGGKSVAQYFGSNSSQDPNKQLIEIFCALKNFNMISLVMSSVFNPFFMESILSTILVKPTVFINETPNSRSLTMISTFSKGFNWFPTYSSIFSMPTMLQAISNKFMSNSWFFY